MPPVTILIDERFEGPPAIANGGYVAGVLAEVIPGPLRVRLHAPAPVGRPLQLDHDDHTVTLSENGTLLASGRAGDVLDEPPEFVGFEDAADALAARGADVDHPFPKCFVCGPDREPSDGLRLLPAPVPGTSVAATPWVPHDALASSDGAISERFVWAALDCPTYWSIAEPGELALLGTLAGRVLGAVRPGDRCVVVARAVGRESRKLLSSSAVYNESGELIGAARATWIKVG
jgi:hypothetical protein